MRPRLVWGIATVTTVALVVTVVPVARSVLARGRGSSSISAKGGTVTSVRLVSDVAKQTTQSTTWVNLSGASTSIGIPEDTTALVLVRFSGLPSCHMPPDFGGYNYVQCLLRVMVGSTEAKPAAGDESVFISAYDEALSASTTFHPVDGLPTTHSIERWIGPLPSGNYPVRIQWMVRNLTNPGTVPVYFDMSNWTLTVERVKVS
jgi:hypothetical protein